MSIPPRAVLGHLLAALCFAVFAVGWTFPVAAQLSSHLPGHPGDNLDFLWNSWWMRQAVQSADVHFFHTDLLFAPFGVDLTLHTHTALSSWLTATLLGSMSVIGAQNVVVIAAIAFNGLAAYLLAWDRTGDRWASLVGGLIFGGSPYLAGHLTGHVNLIGAWCLPLFLLVLLRALKTGSMVASLGAGAVLAATAFNDYYYLVYAIVLLAGVAGAGAWPVTLRARPAPLPRWLLIALVVLLAIDLVIVAVIVASGGFETNVLGLHVIAQRPTNPLAIGWGVLVVALLVRLRPRLSLSRPSTAILAQRARVLLPIAVVAVLGILPLIFGAWNLWQRGDYAAPRVSWRSGPAGVDLATLALGNPWHPWSGGWTRQLYERMDINPVESTAWLGLVPVVLALTAVRRYRADAEVRRWVWIGGVFFLWALGPWLHVGGFDTGLLLPQNLFSFVPILSNARMPGRAMVIVFLAMAMLGSLALARLRTRSQRMLAGVAALLILFDYLPAPLPMTRVEVPALYARLKRMGPGTLCELPVGLRDGFGVTGMFDDRVATYQMVHGHPIVGGFAARIPDSIKRGYDGLPVLRSLLRLSQGGAVDPRDDALDRAGVGTALQSEGIAFIVLNRETAPAVLTAYVEHRIPLRLVTTEGQRDLYVLEGSAQPRSPDR